MTQLQRLDDDLWCAGGHLKMGLGMHFTLRMSVVRLPSGGLWLHSVVPIDDALASELAELGAVEHIVVPNTFHHLYAGAALERYPDAKLWSVPGVEKKQKTLRIDTVLENGTPTPFADVLPHRLVRGTKLNEAVFLHPASGTLLLTDLVFNVHETTGWLTPLVLSMAGAKGKLTQSRLIRTMTKDRALAGADVNEFLGWEFARVVVSHGDIIEGDDARERLAKGLFWMRGVAA